jgi:mRNA-degrading endonuclease toxin of MazEF toxin-antitoxin module
MSIPDPPRGSERAKTRPAVIVSWTFSTEAWTRSDPHREQDRLGDKIGSLSQVEAATLRRVITEMYGE